MKNKTFFNSVKAVLLSMAIMATSCISMNVPADSAVIADAATKIKLNKTKLTLHVGYAYEETYQLKITGTNKKAKWSTSNKNIAAVSQKGKVTAKRIGKAVITAKVINKELKCSVTVKKESASIDDDDTYLYDSDDFDENAEKPVKRPKIEYGKISGNITYHYNAYKGYVPNPNSTVFLIPKDGSLLTVNNPNFDLTYLTTPISQNAIDKLKNIGIYAVKTDGLGNYAISHIPEGDYLVFIISHETNIKKWFNAYDDNIESVPDQYYSDIAEPIKEYVYNDLAEMLGQAVEEHDYAYITTTIYSNEETTISHAFPYTYLSH